MLLVLVEVDFCCRRPHPENLMKMGGSGQSIREPELAVRPNCNCIFRRRSNGVQLQQLSDGGIVRIRLRRLDKPLFSDTSPRPSILLRSLHCSAKMKGCRCIAALYLACSAASATTSSHSDHDHHDHDEHDHSDHAGQFEAAALYTVETGTNSIVLVPSADMMDGTLAFMLVPAASADEEGLEGAEEDAEAGMCGICLLSVLLQ